MKKQLSFIIIYILLINFIFSKNKLNFSANSLETNINNNLEEQVFKDNVIINKASMQLYTDKAIYYPELNKVILINNVKMYGLLILRRELNKVEK